MITGMNHAVLYLRDARVQEGFFTEVLDFTTVAADDDGRALPTSPGRSRRSRTSR
jgi:hypothetical protein